MISPDGPIGTFTVCGEFAAAQVVLVVRGELKRVSAPELGRIATTMVAGGHRRVVLDLAECDSIDAWGLRVIAEGAGHLASWGGELASRMASHLRTMTAIPAGDEVVDGVLRLVVAMAHATVGPADGISVSLRRHGLLSTVAASDQTILMMDAAQYDTGQGPCVDASVEGRWFHAESLPSETRWPEPA